MSQITKARYFEPLHDNHTKCLLCPHECEIPPGGEGNCGVRKNIGGELFAMSVGQVTSLALDPIEKKPLRMFRPGSMILSVGSFGCNLSCAFCQNHTIAQPLGGLDTHYVPPEALAELATRTIPSGNIGVAFTYNEPLIGYEYVLESAKKLRDIDLKAILVTNGYLNPEPLFELLPFIDAINIDLKGGDAFYKNLGGSLQPVMDTITNAAGKTHVEVTTLVISGENEEDVEPIAEWLASVDPAIPLHLTCFHPRYQYADRSPTQRETTKRLAESARKYLMNVFEN